LVGVIQILPGHGWLDLLGVTIVFAIAIAGFLVGTAVLTSHVDPDADGVAERWPRKAA
jgi:hypothetical protein